MYIFGAIRARIEAQSRQRVGRGPDRINITPMTIRTDAQNCGADRRRMSIDMIYLSRTRVPRIFWLLSALRKFGTRRSISSK